MRLRSRVKNGRIFIAKNQFYRFLLILILIGIIAILLSSTFFLLSFGSLDQEVWDQQQPSRMMKREKMKFHFENDSLQKLRRQRNEKKGHESRSNVAVNVTFPATQDKNNYKIYQSSPKDKRIIRFDDACPPLYNPTTPILSSIIPRLSFQSNNGTVFYAYNPTIQPFYGKTNSQASYVISFRVGTIPWLSNPKDYLGIAIFNALTWEMSSYKILDINLHALQQYASSHTKRKSRPTDATQFSDYRLFPFPATMTTMPHGVQSSLYIVTNSISILVISIQELNNVTNATTTNIPIVSTILSNESKEYSSVSQSHLIVRAVSPIRKIRQVVKGRNFNWITLQQNSKPRWFLEEWPLPHSLTSDNSRIEGRKLSEVVVDVNLNDNNWRFTSVNSWESSQLPPPPSFRGPDLDFTVKSGLLSEDRGTACCIQLESQYYQDLYYDPIAITMANSNNSVSTSLSYVLVGISHVKSVKRIPMAHGQKYGYLSRWYAVRPTISPMDIVAQSGLFCWESDTNHTLEWNKVNYSCPVIQFPSGMTESLTDPSYIIVTYGIQDETSRIVSVRKRDIALRLFTSTFV